jgi:hypothetical protein
MDALRETTEQKVWGSSPYRRAIKINDLGGSGVSGVGIESDSDALAARTKFVVIVCVAVLFVSSCSSGSDWSENVRLAEPVVSDLDGLETAIRTERSVVEPRGANALPGSGHGGRVRQWYEPRPGSTQEDVVNELTSIVVAEGWEMTHDEEFVCFVRDRHPSSGLENARVSRDEGDVVRLLLDTRQFCNQFIAE